MRYMDEQGLRFFITISKAEFLSLPPQVSKRCSMFLHFLCLCDTHNQACPQHKYCLESTSQPPLHFSEKAGLDAQI